MWFYTTTGQLVNLTLAARVWPRRNRDGTVDVVASVPGWCAVETAAGGREDRAGYVPVTLFTCSDQWEAGEMIELLYRALRKGLAAADLDVLLELEEEEGEDNGETSG